jgi:heme-degrading monooxygenase HmoA
MIGFKVPPERLEEIENAYLTSLVPEMEKYPGFALVLLIRNKDTNETLEVSIWRTKTLCARARRREGLLTGKRMC